MQGRKTPNGNGTLSTCEVVATSFVVASVLLVDSMPDVLAEVGRWLRWLM